MQINISIDFYTSALSIFILSFGAIFALMQSVFPSSKKILSLENTQILFLGAALFVCFLDHPYKEYLGGSFIFDPITRLAHILILLVSLFISILFRYHPLKDKFFKEEASFLYLVVTTGMLIFTASHDFITLLVALEISSLGGYTLIGYLDPNRKSLEGAIKYFILGSVATAFILFGISFIYAASGSLNISEIINGMESLVHTSWLRGGLLLLLAGLSFKLALAPFHLWTPDAYEGAPTGITALMATSFKTIIVFLILRLLPIFETQGQNFWSSFFSILVCLSIATGSLMALIQISIKRTLAYSSIAHSGYMAIILCYLSSQGDANQTLVFYLASYILASLIAFGSLMFMEKENNQNLSLNDLKGYSRKSPWLSFSLSFSLLSLAGLPPTIGFLGKLFLFKGAMEKGLFFVVLGAILGHAISLYYYLRIMVHMYMEKEDEKNIYAARKPHKKAYLIAIPLVVSVLLGTLLPQKFFDLLQTKEKNSSVKMLDPNPESRPKASETLGEFNRLLQGFNFKKYRIYALKKAKKKKKNLFT